MTSRWITVLVAMVAITIAAAASLVLAPYPLTLLSLVCIAAILASSVNLLVGQAGLLSLGHAGISASAGYAVAWGAVRDMDPLVQVAIALGVTILVSLAYGLMTMRTRGIVFLMITLALGMIVYGLAQKLPTLTGARTASPGWLVPRSSPMRAPSTCHAHVSRATLFACAALDRSPFGLALRGFARARDAWPAWATRWHAPSARDGLSGLLAGLAGCSRHGRRSFVSPPWLVQPVRLRDGDGHRRGTGRSGTGGRCRRRGGR